MAPLPTTNTARLWLDYTSRQIKHSLMLRFVPGTDPNLAMDTAQVIIQGLRSLMMTSDSWYGARFSIAGSTISFPLPFVAVGGTQLDPSDEVDPESFFFSWAGRGPTTGRRYVPKFFGSRGLLNRPADNRWNGNETPAMAVFRQLWVTVSDPNDVSDPIVTAGNDRPIFTAYTNCANNSYWQREQRRG